MPAKKCPRQNSVFLEIRSRRIMRCYLSRLSMGTLYHKLPAKNSRPRPNLELLRIAASRCLRRMQAGRNFRSRAIGGPSRSRPGNGNAARRASVSPNGFSGTARRSSPLRTGSVAPHAISAAVGKREELRPAAASGRCRRAAISAAAPLAGRRGAGPGMAMRQGGQA